MYSNNLESNSRTFSAQMNRQSNYEGLSGLSDDAIYAEQIACEAEKALAARTSCSQANSAFGRDYQGALQPTTGDCCATGAWNINNNAAQKHGCSCHLQKT